MKRTTRFQILLVRRLLPGFMLVIGLFLVGCGSLLAFFRMDVTARALGQVRSARWVDVRPELEGIIRRVLVCEGQRVRQGEILLVLEDRERKLAVENARLKVRELESKLLKIQRNMSMRAAEIEGAIAGARASLAAARARYRLYRKGPKPEELALARSSMEKARRVWEMKQRELEQSRRAHALELVSRLQLDTVLSQSMIAAAELAEARDQIELLRHKVDIEQINAARAAMEAEQGALARALARKGELALLEEDAALTARALDQEKAQLEVLEKHLKLTRVMATIDGYVLTHDPKSLEGRFVSEGSVVLQLGDLGVYVIECRVAEQDLPLIRPGQEARISLAAFPRGEYRHFRGTVTAVGLETRRPASLADMNPAIGFAGILERTLPAAPGTYPVTVSLDAPHAVDIFGRRYEIRPGLSAEVEILVENERILVFLLRRVLRLKGRLEPRRVHL